MGKTIGRKMIVTVGILGLVLFMACLSNLSAWSIIEGQKAQVEANFESYKEAVGQGDAAKMQEAEEQVEYMYGQAVSSKENTNQTISQIRETLEEAVKQSKSVEQINTLTNDILDISSQTNLLALNASIEAARAGEAGKGFAVVADEIRVLADNSRDTASNIQDISQIVNAAVEKLSGSAEQMLQYVKESVLTDYDGFVDIVKQYQSDAEEMNGIFQEFAQKTSEIAGTMKQVNTGIQDISTTVEESAREISDVAGDTNNLVDALKQIKEESDINQTISGELEGQVKRFEKI